MTVELWQAILKPGGPHYAEWFEIFGESRVPLESCKPQMATLGDEKNIEVYKLNLSAMTLEQRARLLGSISKRFQVPIYELEAEIAKVGFPIRAADLIVSYDMRAFV
jgi:hypothetical protein